MRLFQVKVKVERKTKPSIFTMCCRAKTPVEAVRDIICHIAILNPKVKSYKADVTEIENTPYKPGICFSLRDSGSLKFRVSTAAEMVITPFESNTFVAGNDDLTDFVGPQDKVKITSSQERMLRIMRKHPDAQAYTLDDYDGWVYYQWPFGNGFRQAKILGTSVDKLVDCGRLLRKEDGRYVNSQRYGSYFTLPPKVERVPPPKKAD